MMKITTKLSWLFVIAIVSATSCKRQELPAAQSPDLSNKNITAPLTIFSGTFNHPGALHSQQDLDRMKSKVASSTEPWKSDYDLFAADPFSQSTYVLRGPGTATAVNRDTGGTDATGTNTPCQKDAIAAYQNAIMWYITGNVAYANKSRALIDAWASQITSFTGADSKIAASLYGYKFINAAEILAHSGYSGWTTGTNSYDSRAKSFFLGAVYNTIKNYNQIGPGNQDAFIIKCLMSIGVFCERQDIFQSAVDEFYGRNTPANGNLDNYILASGQCQESQRDQGHTQDGLSSLAEACAIGEHQYMDMFGALNNRLLVGCEFTARYNSGNGTASPPVNYHGIAGSKNYGDVLAPTSDFKNCWALAYYHYGFRKGLLGSSSMTYTKQVAESLMPEGAPGDVAFSGYGQLFYAVGPYGGNALTNYSFEGGLGSWYTSGGATLSTSTAQHVEGSQSCAVESRDFDYSSPRQDITSYVNSNGQGLYDLGAYIRTLGSTTNNYTGQVNLKIVDGSGTHYFTASELYSDSWAQISGTVKVSWSGTLTLAEFYVTTPGNSFSIYVDKCSVVKVK